MERILEETFSTRLSLALVLAVAIAGASSAPALAVEKEAVASPTIQVVPGTLELACQGDFEIALRNVSVADRDDLEIHSIMLHHAYSQGDYGTGFTWDTSHLTLPLSLARGESVSIPVSFSAAGQSFSSRLVLEVFSNAVNDEHTHYLAYRGTLCTTPTPTRQATVTPTPTSTWTFECPREIDLAPAAGPAGTVVDLAGFCYAVHSGRSARLFLDGTDIGFVAGDTPGDYRTLLRIPADTPPGRHTIRISPSAAVIYGEGVFTVNDGLAPCRGDCDGDGSVRLNDVVTLIALALGRLEPEACAGEESPGIVDLVAAVESSLAGCGESLDLESFAGPYSVVGLPTDSIGLPGRVLTLEGSAAVSEGELVVRVDAFPGRFTVAGVPDADGSIVLEGTYDVPEQASVAAAGSAVVFVEGETRWITGELSPLGGLPHETWRFSMRR